jgi:hypothetical protein
MQKSQTHGCEARGQVSHAAFLPAAPVKPSRFVAPEAVSVNTDGGFRRPQLRSRPIRVPLIRYVRFENVPDRSRRLDR